MYHGETMVDKKSLFTTYNLKEIMTNNLLSLIELTKNINNQPKNVKNSNFLCLWGVL